MPIIEYKKPMYSKKMEGFDGSRYSEDDSMAENEKKTVHVEELALSNSLTLVALVELLEERGIVRREEVLERAKLIRDRGKSDASHLPARR